MQPRTPPTPRAASAQRRISPFTSSVSVRTVGDHLTAAAAVEEAQRIRRLAGVPVGDYHRFVQPLPRLRQRAADQVVFIHGVVVRVEHVAPVDHLRGSGADVEVVDLDAAAGVVGQQLARRQAAALAQLALVRQPQLVVAEKELSWVECIVEPLDRVGEVLVHVLIRQAARHRPVVNGLRVVVGNLEAVAVVDAGAFGQDDRRFGVVDVVAAAPRHLAHERVHLGCW